MTSRRLPEAIDRLDIRITSTLARDAVPTLRIALGIVFLWFFALLSLTIVVGSMVVASPA